MMNTQPEIALTELIRASVRRQANQAESNSDVGDAIMRALRDLDINPRELSLDSMKELVVEAVRAVRRRGSSRTLLLV